MSVKNKTILFVFGTRPEAIKLAPVIREFYKRPKAFITYICITGQHREMLMQVLDLFKIEPDFNLDIMQPKQTLSDIFSRVLTQIEPILDKCAPDYVIVHGDTSTTIAASLAAYYKKIKVVHVEAGLRTNNIYNPWPEEINRQLTTKIAYLHFCPTEESKSNLISEKIDPNRIFVTGNTVIDALFHVVDELKMNKKIIENAKVELERLGIPKNKIDAWQKGERPRRKMVLVTIHRRESFGQQLSEIFQAISEYARADSDIDFVFPMHKNPIVRDMARKVFKDDYSKNSNIILIEPLNYVVFVYLMRLSYLILTDSGGIQEEAPSLGKPVLVARKNTERPEAIAAGTVKLVGTKKDKIRSTLHMCISNKEVYQKMSNSINPYGDGKASLRIINAILNDN